MGRICKVLAIVVPALGLAAEASVQSYKAGATHGVNEGARAVRSVYEPEFEELLARQVRAERSATEAFHRERDNHINDVLTLAWENNRLRAELPDNGRQVVRERKIYLPGLHYWPEPPAGICEEQGFVEDAGRPAPPLLTDRCRANVPLAEPAQVPK